MNWFKDKQSLKDDYRTDIYNTRDERYLEICDAKLTDSGEYKLLVALNNKDNDSSSSKEFEAICKIEILANSKKAVRPNIEGLYQYGKRYLHGSSVFFFFSSEIFYSNCGFLKTRNISSTSIHHKAKQPNHSRGKTFANLIQSEWNSETRNLMVQRWQAVENRRRRSTL